MPLVILKSSYVKSLKHFVNLITYCDSKVEAQMAVDPDGTLRAMTTEEILKLAPDKELKLQLENGKTVTTTVERFALKYAEKSVEEHYQTEIYTDDNIEREFQTDKWLKYIANRPSSKGLFNQFGAMDENEAVRCAQEHFDSIKWSHIVSLERSDAERLGYDNPQAWQTLIAAKLPDIAKLHNISLENIVVNASYHDKDHHPHIHLFVYSRDSREGHFKGTDALIDRTERIKSLFTNEIFRGDLEHIKVNKNQMRTQMQETLRQKCIAIAQKKHIPSPELIDSFSEISNIMLDSKGRKYYEYQPSGVKSKINDLLKCAVKSDKYINQIYTQLKKNQEEFVRAYNDDEEKIKVRMDEWEKRFFEPQKSDDKRLHNIIVEYAAKVSAANPECANYVLSQSLWDIIPSVCSYAENRLDSDKISYNECALIKDNAQDIAKAMAAKLSWLDDTAQVEKEFDRQYLKLTNKLLNQRLMSSDLKLSLYTPDEFADIDNINVAHYTHRACLTANKQSSLYSTAASAAETFYDTLGEKAIGSVILLHNAQDSARAFLITEGGKAKQIYNAEFATKAAVDGILPKRYELFDEEAVVSVNNAGTKEKTTKAIQRKIDPEIAKLYAQKYSALQLAVNENKDVFDKVLKVNKALNVADFELNIASLSIDTKAALSELCQRLSDLKIEDTSEKAILKWISQNGDEVISNALCEKANIDSVNSAVYKAITESFDNQSQNFLEYAICGMSEFPKKYSECDEVQECAVNDAMRMCLADSSGRQALEQFNQRLENIVADSFGDSSERMKILDDIRKHIFTPERYGKMQSTVLFLSHRAQALQYNARIKRCKEASKAVNKAAYRELANEKYVKKLIELNEAHQEYKASLKLTPDELKEYQPRIAVMPKALQFAARDIFNQAHGESVILQNTVNLLENAYKYDEKCYPKQLSPDFREHFFNGTNGELQSHYNTIFSAAENVMQRTHSQVLKQNESVAELKCALRNALSLQDKSYIKSIANGRPFQLLNTEEKATLNTILQNVVINNQDTANAFEKVISEQYRLYCERFDESTAQKLTDYTRKALFEPKEYEASPVQNTAVFYAENNTQQKHSQMEYSSKMMLFRLAMMMASSASQHSKANTQSKEQNRSKAYSKAISKAHNKNISAENEESYSGFEY
ncbi:MAG: hypothetical protein IJO29_01420 [Oscillospiraceae bacterium]|nr:hypothetical protein [Oscillospiraceae bacterium]